MVLPKIIFNLPEITKIRFVFKKTNSHSVCECDCSIAKDIAENPSKNIERCPVLSTAKELKVSQDITNTDNKQLHEMPPADTKQFDIYILPSDSCHTVGNVCSMFARKCKLQR